jgi:hypothetical protein
MRTCSRISLTKVKNAPPEAGHFFSVVKSQFTIFVRAYYLVVLYYKYFYGLVQVFHRPLQLSKYVVFGQHHILTRIQYSNEPDEHEPQLLKPAIPDMINEGICAKLCISKDGHLSASASLKVFTI